MSDREDLQRRLRRNLYDYMLKRGPRSTQQRHVIINAFFDAGEHITIDGLHKRVQQVDERVGYATVYRTMKLLSQSGIVEEHEFGDGFTAMSYRTRALTTTIWYA